MTDRIDGEQTTVSPVEDQDVEGHSLLALEQGRELHQRRSREAREWAESRARAKEAHKPSRLRRLLGG